MSSCVSAKSSTRIISFFVNENILRPIFNLLETYIQMGIRLMNMQMILEALDMFKKLKRHPKNSTLKFLGNLKNLPV